MDPQAGKMKYSKPDKMHLCPRHKDLTILLNAANKKICNTCFSMLKKSYFNVIAGLLLEEHYLHNVTRGILEQNNSLQKQVQDLTQAQLNLQAEITEIKKNGGNNHAPRPKTPSAAPSNPGEMEPQHKTPDPQKVCTKGHVAQVAHSLQDLLHLQIGRILDKWKKAGHRTTPKTHDRQHKRRYRHPPYGKLLP